MNIGIIILARTSSSRLPGKVLKKINGKSILSYIVERLVQAVDLNNIVVATSEDRSDDAIEIFCLHNGIGCYRGELNDVSNRFLSAANEFKFDYAVRINGDNLFVDIPVLISMLTLIEKGYDFITNVPGRTFPRGMSIEIVKTKVYKKLYKNFRTSAEFEHVTTYLYNNMNILNVYTFVNTICKEAANLQMAIDTEYDFRLAKKIILGFANKHTEYNLKEIYALYTLHMESMSFTGKFGPLLIAEIGGNHEGNFEYAKKLTKLAIESDADFIKFQIYSGDTLVNPVISPDRNRHFKKFELSREQYVQLAKMVEESGKKFMASIWDASMLDWVDNYVSVYKIGSGDLMAWPLLKEISKYNKPIVLSTGLATEQDIKSTVEFLQNTNFLYKDKEYLSLLQCTSMYPIPSSEANLSVISRLKSITNLTIGYSDHTEGYRALVYAACMGAQILEFHFTDDRKNKTFRDHQVSLTKKEVWKLILEIQKINTLFGDEIKEPTELEKHHNHVESFRRGVYLNKNLYTGEVIRESDLTILRPDKGISSQYFYDLIGKKVLCDISKYEKLDWEKLG